MSLKSNWNRLHPLLKGGIIGSVLFFIIWNLAFLLAYVLILPGLWYVLFYVSYPTLQPTVHILNFLFGNCYSATRCYFRIPFIFVIGTLVEGFVLGAIIEQCRSWIFRIFRIKNE
jgi:hypothetical protein